MSKLLGPDEPVFVCDVERQEEIDRLRDEVARAAPTLHGIVHSIAYADYSFGRRPFHQVPRAAFLQALDISCYSLIAVSEAFRERLDPTEGSVVTVSISTTRMAAENYGYMAPVKAALDSAVCFLAKSFSEFSRVRFNAVCPGLLKTSASAGIPGYVDSYLFAEQATPAKRGRPHGGSRRGDRLPDQSPLFRNQCAGARDRRRNGDQLFRPANHCRPRRTAQSLLTASSPW